MTSWAGACQASLSFLSPGACSNSCPSSRWCHQPSHPLLSPSPPALNFSQHQSLFQWVGSSHQVTRVMELRHQSFQWIFLGFPLGMEVDEWIFQLSLSSYRKNSKACFLQSHYNRIINWLFPMLPTEENCSIKHSLMSVFPAWFHFHTCLEYFWSYFQNKLLALKFLFKSMLCETST